MSTESPDLQGRAALPEEAKTTIVSQFPPGSLTNMASLPVPSLTLDFRLKVDLNPKIALGHGVWGERNWISFKAGEWSATWGHGIVEVSVRQQHIYAMQSADDE